jgi:hypothetical protein
MRTSAFVACRNSKMSVATPLPSGSGARFVALVWNTTNAPSSLIEAPKLSPLASVVPRLDTRAVVPSMRSRTNTSLAPLSSFLTRLLAEELNTTSRPLSETS